MSRKKKAGELTSNGLARRLFGPEAVKEAKRKIREEEAKKSEKKRPIKKQGS